MTSPICVSDSFHFSHYYWKDSGYQSDDSSVVYENCDNEVYKPTPIDRERIDLKFYSQVLGDESGQIHYGKWDGVDQDQPGAYGKASERMTEFMFDIARSIRMQQKEGNIFKYIDLGSGTGAAAIHLLQQHTFISEVTCLNLCLEQNRKAFQAADALNLSSRMKVVNGNFESPPFPSDEFDLTFSQDAFIHAVSKRRVYSEAYRITKPGGTFVFCDLMRGTSKEISKRETDLFKKKNTLNDWLSPAGNVKACNEVGWGEVNCLDLTSDLRISFKLMLKKIDHYLEREKFVGMLNQILLTSYRERIQERIVQIDRGVFTWCAIHARKPVFMEILCDPPVPFMNTNKLLSTNKKDIHFTPNVIVVDILTPLTKQRIETLPKSTQLVITLSAGLDHIDVEACFSRGIQIKQSGRNAITAHVVEYTLGLLILGLRDALNQLTCRFPTKGWNLLWNCKGKSLNSSKIAIIGLGRIARLLIEEIRKSAPLAEIFYFVPGSSRNINFEETFNVQYFSSIVAMASICDVLVPLCSLTEETEKIVDRSVLYSLPPHAGFINVGRGKLVDHDALVDILHQKKIKYAILDTTFPEPLPEGHPLYSESNCFIFPHYATNTMEVRQALVSEIQSIVEDHFGLGQSKQEETIAELRPELAIAHRLSAKYGLESLLGSKISGRSDMGFLCTPSWKMWSKMQPSDLIVSPVQTETEQIHAAIYDARPDVNAIISLSTPRTTTVACFKDGFQAYTRNGTYFDGKIVVCDSGGGSNDTSYDASLIQSALVSAPNCCLLQLRNQGFICFGRSVRDTWVLAYYFDRCCEIQINLSKSHNQILMPSVDSNTNGCVENKIDPTFLAGQEEWDSFTGGIMNDDA